MKHKTTIASLVVLAAAASAQASQVLYVGGGGSSGYGTTVYDGSTAKVTGGHAFNPDFTPLAYAVDFTFAADPSSIEAEDPDSGPGMFAYATSFSGTYSILLNGSAVSSGTIQLVGEGSLFGADQYPARLFNLGGTLTQTSGPGIAEFAGGTTFDIVDFRYDAGEGQAFEFFLAPAAAVASVPAPLASTAGAAFAAASFLRRRR